MKRYYTLKEACAEIEVSRATIMKAIAHLGIRFNCCGKTIKITDKSLQRLDNFFSSPQSPYNLP